MCVFAVVYVAYLHLQDSYDEHMSQFFHRGCTALIAKNLGSDSMSVPRRSEGICYMGGRAVWCPSKGMAVDPSVVVMAVLSRRDVVRSIISWTVGVT